VSLRIAPPIREALRTGLPVVALESTVVTHGLPRPRNLDLARRLELVVREAGALPATVGVLDGALVVGVDDVELQRLANDDTADKASLWNVAAVLARGAAAGTTVATTLYAATRAGIQVFATGGIGGVHDRPFDESADLAALGRFPVLTVCAGPKSILDAAGTLERLESLGVPVLGYRSTKLAGFVVSEVDLPLPARVETPREAARVLLAQRALGLDAGIVLSNPVSDGLDPQRFAAWLDLARSDLSERGVRGRDTTPYLLARLAELSEGATVDTNLRLLEENARLAGAVAVELCDLGPARPEVAAGAAGAVLPGGSA